MSEKFTAIIVTQTGNVWVGGMVQSFTSTVTLAEVAESEGEKFAKLLLCKKTAESRSARSVIKYEIK